MRFENFETKYHELLKQEWMIDLGCGSYAMNNLLLVPSRRYHSLYNSSQTPPVNRISLFHSIDETIKIDDQYFNLYSRRIDEKMIFPEGYKYMQSIDVNPLEVIYTYYVKGVEIKKIINFNSEKDILSIRYDLINTGEKKILFFIRPFFENRNSSMITEKSEKKWKLSGNRVFFSDYDYVFFPDKEYNFINKDDEKKIFLEREKEYVMEDHYLEVKSPGYYEIGLKEKNQSYIFSFEKEEKRDIKRCSGIKSDNNIIDELVDFSRSFIVNDDEKTYIMAGYPWFGPWGRDTFISLPGLVIYQNEISIAEKIIDSFALNIKDGIIPNLITENATLSYNTVDASLWLINSIYELFLKSGNIEYVKKYYELVLSIIFNYRKGTFNNIFMDKEDFLISAGNEDSQLTWMDAKNNGVVFTPRGGKPVEIQALWFNAIKIAEEFSAILNYKGNTVKFYNLAEKIKKSFLVKFWNESGEYLNDYIDLNGKIDKSFRSNQIYAISLPYNILDDVEKIKKILLNIKERLLTEHGLRTLEPDDKKYKGKYRGNWFDRDSVYHQGSVWPYIIGAYLEAMLKVNDFSDISKIYIKKYILGFIEKNYNIAGCGYIAEIFDGDPPYNPQGAPCQAWSVAEILKVYFKYFNEEED